MKILRTRADLYKEISARREKGDKIAFVPTMGALHAGHLSLIKYAHMHADCIIASIFVNTTQFAPHEDFDSYPRTENSDCAQLEKAGVDMIFIPSEEEIYHDGYKQLAEVGNAAKGLETNFRPHFFGGVVNIVYRLFQYVTPDIAIFGEKDYQQLRVIQEMVENNNIPVRVIGAPIIRDEHGLALSSRNAYLSEVELATARLLNKTLITAARTKDILGAKDLLLSYGFDKIDYIEMRWGRILVAAWLGKTRLIDNMPVSD